VHSPFGETERSAGRWLPYLRLFAAVALTGVAILALQLGAAGQSLNDGILVLARNVIGFTGLGLLCSLVTGGLLAWILPMGYMAFCQYALLEAWTAPWTWPVRPPADRGAWICASVAFAGGLLLLTIFGPSNTVSAGQRCGPRLGSSKCPIQPWGGQDLVRMIPRVSGVPVRRS